MQDKQKKMIFLIAAIVILGIIILQFIAPIESLVGFAFFEGIEMKPIRTVVDNCITDVGVPGIYLLGKQGGYLYDFEPVSSDTDIAYHVDKGRKIPPTKEFMERELERYFEGSLNTCVGEFEDADNYTFGEITTDVKISDDYIDVLLDYPITYDITKRTTREFSKRISIRLGHILNIKDKILNNIIYTNNVDFNFLSSFDVGVNAIPYDGESTFYTIEDKKSVLEDTTFKFNFGVLNNFVKNDPPTVNDPPESFAYINEPFFLNITAYDPDGDELTFDADTIMFDISPIPYYSNNIPDENGRYVSGVINFTPSILDEGVYEIPITVTDGTYNVDKTLKLTIYKRFGYSAAK